MDALNKAIETIGNQARLARALGISQQTVNNWMRRGNVPAEYCPAIEKATDAAVTCEALRPDVDWNYVRGTSPVGADATPQPVQPQTEAA